MAARDLPFTLSNPRKVYFPETGAHPAWTKEDVVAYYDAVAGAILPHVARRPMVLRRYPEGITAPGFFQKDYDATAPPFVRRADVWSESRSAVRNYIVVDNRETLLWLVQLGCIEMHPWLSRIGDCEACAADLHAEGGHACGLDHPDVLVVDCDPYVRQGRLGRRPSEAGGEPGIAREDFEPAARVALVLRDLLRGIGIRSFPKTSGKRGVHVYVPIEPRHTYEQVRAFAGRLGAHVAAAHPRLVTTAYAKEARKGRVFFDYNQNVRGKTLASPWSLRPTPEASVSMPLRWEELEDADPARFTIETAPERWRRGDPWAGYAPQDLARLVAG